MNAAQQGKRSAAGDVLTFLAVAGLGFAVTIWNDASRLVAGMQWPSLRELREGGPASWALAGRSGPELEEPPRYRAKPGDTLSRIAAVHGVSLDELVSLNRIEDPDRLDVGTTLLIPVSEDDSPTASPDLAAVLDGWLSGLGLGRGMGGRGEAPPPVVAPAAHELVELAEQELLDARFRDALETSEAALRLLGPQDDSPLADPKRARLEIVRATAHAAFGRPRAAQSSFERALASDPDLVLDPARHPPKLLRAFRAACLHALPDRELACRSAGSD